MKKITLLCTLCTIIFLVCLLTGCNKSRDYDDNSDYHYNNIPVFSGYNIHRNSEEKTYQVVDSFELGDGKYYYLYYVGMVDVIPLSTEDCEGIYYSGERDEKVTLKRSETLSTSSQREIGNITSSLISSTISTSIGGSVSIGYKGIVEEKVEAGIENSLTNSITQTRTTTISNAIKNEKSFSVEISYDLKAGVDKAGYYCYTTVASMKLYEIIVYNPETEKIEAVTPYSVIGNVNQGVLYSTNSFFEYDEDDNKIIFDVNKISFPTPVNKLTTPGTVILDSKSGICDITSKDYLLGQSYGMLPIPTKIGYIFDGWYQNDKKITEETPVINFDNIEAKYKLKTEFYYSSASGTNSQNIFGSSSSLEEGHLQINIGIQADIATLQDEGYMVRFVLEYDVKSLTFGIGKTKYYIKIKSSSNVIYNFEDSFSSSEHRVITSNEISTTLIDGYLDIILGTKNIQGVEIKNVRVNVLFKK